MNNMFGNNPYMFGIPTIPNSMPTSTQPYGSPFTNLGMLNNQQFSMQQPQVNTNKIYVTNMEDARNKQLPNNSDYIFLDNDKALLYRKTVDATGKMDFQVFDIIPHDTKLDSATTQSIDTSNFVPIDEFNKFKQDFEKFKTEIKENQILP